MPSKRATGPAAAVQGRSGHCLSTAQRVRIPALDIAPHVKCNVGGRDWGWNAYEDLIMHDSWVNYLKQKCAPQLQADL